MAKTGKNSVSSDPLGEELPFEEALHKLEAIVQSMESEDLSLENLLAQYEAGTRLTQICQAKLAEAELKIQQLEQNRAGQPVLKPFDLSEENSDK